MLERHVNAIYKMSVAYETTDVSLHKTKILPELGWFKLRINKVGKAPKELNDNLIKQMKLRNAFIPT